MRWTNLLCHVLAALIVIVSLYLWLSRLGDTNAMVHSFCNADSSVYIIDRQEVVDRWLR